MFRGSWILIYQGLYVQGKLDPNVSRFIYSGEAGSEQICDEEDYRTGYAGHCSSNFKRVTASIYSTGTVGYILQVQQDIFYRYSRIYSTGTAGHILQVKQYIFYRYSGIYSTGTAGYILQVQQDIFYRYSRVYSEGTAGYILQVQQGIF